MIRENKIITLSSEMPVLYSVPATVLSDPIGFGEGYVFYKRSSLMRSKKVLNEADIFILNSRTADDGDMEGTPVSLLEAMSMGKAVISTNHAGIPYVIQNNENGMLVPERDNEKLELAMRDLIENEEKRINLGKQARQTVVSRFSNQVNLPVLRDTLMGVVL
jgi:colanic acid/amylovoran biosynthesis glycosyltransferase